MKNMFNKIIQAGKLIFSKSTGDSTAAEKSKERYRRAGRNAVTAFTARVVNIGTGLITIPLTLSYLGKEQFGLWMTLTGFVGFLTFSDMGLGIGLQNALAECNGKEDKRNPSRYISTTAFVMILLMILFISIAIFILPYFELAKLFRLETESAKKELLLTVQSLFITFGIGLPCGLIQKIYVGYQDGYRADFWLTIGRMVALFGVLICIYFKLGLPYLMAIFLGSPFLFQLIGSIFFFKKKPWLRPSLRNISFSCLRRIFGTGLSATGAQIGCVMIFSGPAIIIANRLGVAAVTPFAVAQKLLGTATIILTTVILPLWPAYGEALARGDWSWILKTFKRTLKFGYIIQLPIFCIILLSGRWIILHWAGKEAVPTWGLLWAINIWYFFWVWTQCSSILLNGLDHMVGQGFYCPSLALIGLTVGYFLADSYAVTGIVISMALIAVLGTGICCGIEIAWVLHKNGNWSYRNESNG